MNRRDHELELDQIPTPTQEYEIIEEIGVLQFCTLKESAHDALEEFLQVSRCDDHCHDRMAKKTETKSN